MSGQIYLNVATKASETAQKPADAEASDDLSVLVILGARLAAPIDAATRDRAATHVLDWLGSALLGDQQPRAAGFAALAKEHPSGYSPPHHITKSFKSHFVVEYHKLAIRRVVSSKNARKGAPFLGFSSCRYRSAAHKPLRIWRFRQSQLGHLR